MIVPLDVQYDDARAQATAAAVVFARWTDYVPATEYTAAVDNIQPYVPGEFFRRELPCLVAVISKIREPLGFFVVDGYVRLGPCLKNSPGLRRVGNVSDYDGPRDEATQPKEPLRSDNEADGAFPARRGSVSFQTGPDDWPGLGQHLFDHFGGRVPVVGVAKTRFHGAAGVEVFRGGSKSPLHVTAVGCDPAEAANRVREMHGSHRIPTLLKRADQLAKGR